MCRYKWSQSQLCYRGLFWQDSMLHAFLETIKPVQTFSLKSIPTFQHPIRLLFFTSTRSSNIWSCEQQLLHILHSEFFLSVYINTFMSIYTLWSMCKLFISIFTLSFYTLPPIGLSFICQGHNMDRVQVQNSWIPVFNRASATLTNRKPQIYVLKVLNKVVLVCIFWSWKDNTTKYNATFVYWTERGMSHNRVHRKKKNSHKINDIFFFISKYKREQVKDCKIIKNRK